MANDQFFMNVAQILICSLIIYFILWCLLRCRAEKSVRKAKTPNLNLWHGFQRTFNEVLPLLNEAEKAEIERVFTNTLKNVNVASPDRSRSQYMRSNKKRPSDKTVRFNLPAESV